VSAKRGKASPFKRQRMRHRGVSYRERDDGGRTYFVSVGSRLLTPVADAKKPGAAFSDNQAELEQVRAAESNLTAGASRSPGESARDRERSEVLPHHRLIIAARLRACCAGRTQARSA
jgi:hypothetical protein